MKKRIILKGKKVHNVGYRLFLMDAAEDFGIENFDVKNLKENDKEIVSIRIESSDENVNNFINFVKTNFPEHADVDKQSIEINDYEGKINSFEVFERSFMRHQTAKIANAGIGMLEKQDLMIQKQDLMIQKQDQMIQKQDQMLEKQDITIGILKDIKQDTKNISSVLDEINDLKIKYDRMNMEINDIKKILKLQV